MNTNPSEDEMDEEYDFTVGERSRLAKRLETGYEIVIDGDEDHAVNMSPAQVRAAQVRLDHHRKRGARKGA